MTGSAYPVELAELLEDVERERRRWERTERRGFDAFVQTDPEQAWQALSGLSGLGGRFLEWGSGMGTVSLLAASVGFEAYGIEAQSELVTIARDLSARHGIPATFVEGTFIPDDCEDLLATDPELSHDFVGPDGYGELGMEPTDFDVFYVFPWSGEELFFVELFRRLARPGAILLANLGGEGIQTIAT